MSHPRTSNKNIQMQTDRTEYNTKYCFSHLTCNCMLLKDIYTGYIQAYMYNRMQLSETSLFFII